MSPQPQKLPSCLPPYETINTNEWGICIDGALVNDASRPFLTTPHRFFKEALVTWFKQGRNNLAEVRWPRSSQDSLAHSPFTVVLKEYGASGPVGMLRGIFSSSPRAVRAWRQAFALLERNFKTPRPLYLALPRHERFGRSYLAVETAPPHIRLREILKQIKTKTETITIAEDYQIQTNEFIGILARYVRRMHDAGIWHRDFSGGNLLIPRDWRAPTYGATDAIEPFVLIDVNRARLLPPGALTLSQRMQDLERISLPKGLRSSFYETYAAGNKNLAAALPLYLRSASRYRKLRDARNPVARFLRRVFTYWLRLP